MSETRYLTRTEIKQIVCPQCGAGIGQPCTSPGGYVRRANHARRVNMVAQKLGITLPHTLRRG